MLIRLPPYIRRATDEFSPCRQYRYALDFCWDEAKPRLMVIGLNPSVATRENVDPTVLRCCERARRYGMGGLWMRNLYPFVSTDPQGLWAAAAPLGDALKADCRVIHDATIVGVGGMVLVAWGALPNERAKGRARMLTTEMRKRGVVLMSLGETQMGDPRHPLYVPYGIEPKVWRDAWAERLR